MAGWKQKLAETARQNRVELIDAKLSRRDLFKLGLLTSSGFLVTKMGLSSRAAGASGTPPAALTCAPSRSVGATTAFFLRAGVIRR